MNRASSAIVKKDMREITANRQLLLTIVVVPLVLTLVMPTIYFLTAHFAPEEVEELQQLTLSHLAQELLKQLEK